MLSEFNVFGSVRNRTNDVKFRNFIRNFTCNLIWLFASNARDDISEMVEDNATGDRKFVALRLFLKSRAKWLREVAQIYLRLRERHQVGF